MFTTTATGASSIVIICCVCATGTSTLITLWCLLRLRLALLKHLFFFSLFLAINPYLRHLVTHVGVVPILFTCKTHNFGEEEHVVWGSINSTLDLEWLQQILHMTQYLMQVVFWDLILKAVWAFVTNLPASMTYRNLGRRVLYSRQSRRQLTLLLELNFQLRFKVSGNPKITTTFISVTVL